jgi:hypothetical protein
MTNVEYFRFQNFKQPHFRIPATPFRPGSTNSSSLQNRGRRECRMPDAPAASRAKMKKHTSKVTTGSLDNAGIPCASGFNSLLRALFGDRAFLSPSPRNAKHCRELTSASRRQDHTASPSAISAHSSRAPSRPPHPAPNVRDDRETPLFVRQDDAKCEGDLGSRSTATQWHDGQITFTLRKRVKCQANAASSVIPRRSRKRE